MSNYQTMARELQRLRDSGRQLPPAVADAMASLDRLDAQIKQARAKLDAAHETARRAALRGPLSDADLMPVLLAEAHVKTLEAAMLAQLQAAHAVADRAGILPPRRVRPGALPTVRVGAFQ